MVSVFICVFEFEEVDYLVHIAFKYSTRVVIMSDKGAGPRRGSSLFSGPGAMGSVPPSGNHSPPNKQGAAPIGMAGGGGGRRNSTALPMGPGGGVGVGIDFDDSDYEDSEDEEDVRHAVPHRGGPPAAASVGSGTPMTTGSANSRPMVGGFAAAAYEAAKAHHFQTVKKQQEKGGRPGEPKPESPGGRH